MTALIIAAASITSLSGCVALSHGSHQGVAISSRPSHAKITVDGVDRGMTPMKVPMTRKNDHEITLTHPGYEIYKTKVTHAGHMGHAFLEDGILGGAVDGAMGADSVLTPGSIDAHLVPTLATLEAQQGQGVKSANATQPTSPKASVSAPQATSPSASVKSTGTASQNVSTQPAEDVNPQFHF